MDDPSSATPRVFGVDPGSRVAGWAVVERRGASLLLVACGAVSTRAAEPERRLAEIYAGLRQAAADHHCRIAAVEEVFAGRNLKVALQIGQGRGVALAALGALGMAVHSYPARVVKRAVTGNGNASKEQVARMVTMQLGLAKPPQPADVTDACAVAMTHLIRARTPEGARA
jgi:crossover junction endodeoxyribonuclease RuvC